MYRQEIKIPKDRVGALIGKDGELKKQLEKKTKTKIMVDSETGDVTIEGEDPVILYSLKDVVLAVGRGFNPQIAKQLLKEDVLLEIIHIQDYAGKSRKKLDRLRGRVIGAKGKSRNMIEQLSDTNVSVYGKTVAIIGEPEKVEMARHAVDALLLGSPHGNVYKWLQDKRRELARRMFEDEVINTGDKE